MSLSKIAKLLGVVPATPILTAAAAAAELEETAAQEMEEMVAVAVADSPVLEEMQQDLASTAAVAVAALMGMGVTSLFLGVTVEPAAVAAVLTGEMQEEMAALVVLATIRTVSIVLVIQQVREVMAVEVELAALVVAI
jgi:hypothetical protein